MRTPVLTLTVALTIGAGATAAEKKVQMKDLPAAVRWKRSPGARA